MADSTDYLVDGEPNRVAVSRLTRTPILFKKGTPNDTAQGRYSNLSNADLVSKTIGIMPFLKMFQQGMTPGTMEVYPNVASDPGSVVRHESIHALMDRTYPKGSSEIPIDPQMMAKVAPYLKFLKSDQLQTEAPAYAAINDSATGIPSDIQQSFVNQLADNISKTSPKSAEIYRRIANIR